jgi:hypothetical protein
MVDRFRFILNKTEGLDRTLFNRGLCFEYKVVNWVGLF